MGIDPVLLSDSPIEPGADLEAEAASKDLSVRRLLFCYYYANTLNGKQSAISAKFSPKTAASTAVALLKDPRIIMEIRNIQNRKLRALNRELVNKSITHERVLEELAYIAFFNPQECYDEHNNLLPVNEMPEHVARAIGSLKVKEIFSQGGDSESRERVGFLTEMKPNDKLKALEMLAKNLGLLNIKIDVNQKAEITHKVQIQQMKTQFKNLEVEELEVLANLLQKASADNREKKALTSGKPPHAIDIEPIKTASVLVKDENSEDED